MTTTRFFRFPDEATFLASMPAGFQRGAACEPPLPDETGAPLPEGVEAMRILPHPLTQGGAWDANFVQIEAPTVLPGFHVNILAAEAPAGWAAYEIFPGSPLGVFGGGA